MRLRTLLYPFSVLYHAITALRNLMFDWGLLKQRSFDIPIIGVGNLNTGGTGKTPHVIYIAEQLQQKNLKVAVLSRGYGRKSTGYIRADAHTPASQIGDEPYEILQRLPNIYMAVCEDRVKGIEQLVKEVNPEVIVLDDNMQHRYVKPRQQIMLTSYHDLFYDDYILPAGNLRESRKGANRADVIIVSKCPDNMNFEVEDAIRKNINKYNSKATVLFSRYIYTTPNFPARDVILLTGLAETNYILNHVQQHYNILGHLKYKDHYSYTQDDIENWKERYKNEFAAGAVILTTAKDAARLSNRKYDLPLHVLGVEIHFCNKKELEIFAL